MSKLSEVEFDFSMMGEKPIDYHKVLMKYFIHWKWFLLSIIIFLFFAVVVIFFSLPRYQVETSILFRDDQRGSTSEVSAFRDLGMLHQKNNADNEVEILKKTLIVEKVVRELGLHVSYTALKPMKLFTIFGLDKAAPLISKRKVKSLYGDESPIKVVMSNSDLNNLYDVVVLNVLVKSSGEMELIGKYADLDIYRVVRPNDSIIHFPFGSLEIIRHSDQPSHDQWVKVEVLNPQSVANGFLGSIEVELTSKTSSVADISLVCSNISLGRDFLQKYISIYNELGLSYNIELADQTAQLIDNHLVKLNNELSDVESQVQDYKQSQGLTDIASQANLYNAQLASVADKRMNIESQLAIVSSLNDFVQQITSHDQLIPANSGVQSAILNSQIDGYNNLVIERNRLSRIASGTNQSMINLNSQIESMFSSVRTGLQNEKRNLEIQQRDIMDVYNQNRARISAIPRQERIYSDIKRQQNVKEELFLHLLQKKEEKYINMATVAPSSRIIDNIHVAGVVSPRKMIIIPIFFFIGLLIPFILIQLKSLLRYKISSKEDLEDLTLIPVLGEIPKLSGTENMRIKENCNDSFNEMVRLLRANLLFIIDSKDKKVINILSSMSGEGKTFVSINLAISLALLDKKVLLIDLDIRKPKLAKELGMEGKEGITLYLSGYLKKEEIIRQSDLHPNLSVVTAGAIPPNPNELLARPNLDELIKEFKNEYDFILIDTAPVGMVSDGFLLNRLSDVNLYVVRSDYTPKKYIEDLNRHNRENRLDKLYFILNSVNLDAAEYRYGFGKKYAYGYGYQ